MKMKHYAKFEEKLTCRFKNDMRNLTNFDQSTQMSQKFALYWTRFGQGFFFSILNIKPAVARHI